MICRHFEVKLKCCVYAGDILKANDDLSRVINSYKHIVEGQPADSESEVIRPAFSQGDSFCIFTYSNSLCFPTENNM